MTKTRNKKQNIIVAKLLAKLKKSTSELVQYNICNMSNMDICNNNDETKAKSSKQAIGCG